MLIKKDSVHLSFFFASILQAYRLEHHHCLGSVLVTSFTNFDSLAQTGWGGGRDIVQLMACWLVG